MRIKRLEIENYRQYRSLALDLSGDRGNFVIVIGSMGAGKTNLLNAVIWCLFGREDYYSRDMEASPMVNQSALDDSKNGDVVECSVTLELAFADGAEARITRTQDFRKSGRVASPQPQRLQVISMESAQQGHRSEANPEHWIERWVPSRLEPYFLFDGERLDSFFRHAESQKVKDAVLQIAQIDLLVRMIDHLEKVSGRLYSKAAREKGGEDAQLVAQQLDDRRQRLDKTEAELAGRRAGVNEFEDTVRILDSKIGDIASVVRDVEKRRGLQDELAKAQRNLLEARAELYTWAVRMAPAVLTVVAIEKAQAEIDEARRSRRLPPPVAPSILERLLQEGTCVCGRPLEPGSDHREHIESLLAEYAQVGRLGSALLDIEPHVRNLAGRLSETEAVAESIARRIDDWERRARTLSQDLAVLDARLAGHEDSKVVQLQTELNRAKEALKEENRLIARLEIDAETLRENIARLEKDLERWAGKEEKLQGMLNEAQFARHCLEVASRVYGQLTDEVRNRVAETLDTRFRRMGWKDDFFQSVSIDPDYQVSVRNRLGYEILPDLSAGERECLALAFALSLGDVAGYELPMVIDTPMGRLSPEVQVHVSQVLAESTSSSEGSGHQLIMLMTETEYNAQVAAVLAERKPRVLRIDFDTKRAVAELVEVS